MQPARNNCSKMKVCKRISDVQEYSFICSYPLQNMQSLEEVNLSDNGIAVEGMLELVQAFRSHSKLKIIMLSGNKLSADGAVAFAEVSTLLILYEMEVYVIETLKIWLQLVLKLILL